MKRLVTHKICTHCKEEKPHSAFGQDNGTKDGLYRWCKECAKARRTDGHTKKVRKSKFYQNAPPGTRRCSYCKEFRPLSFFTDSIKSGKGYVCSGCKPEYHRSVWYRTKYGMSLTEIEQLLTQQENKCAACKDELNSFHLDHCHENRKVRGILCHHCNVALGHLRDDPIRIQQLFSYLVGESN